LGAKGLVNAPRDLNDLKYEGGDMKLNLRALSITTGIITAAAILLTGILNLIFTEYGTAFLNIMASVYPGYDASGSVGDLIVGTLYGWVDGLIFGLIFGWLYNRFAMESVVSGKRRRPTEP
jgi:hypothetical protein